MTSVRNRKFILTAIIILFTVLLLVDRYYWAQISQWREDQSTNLWLGYTSDISNMPVGLISSQGIPNPNGMLLLGKILSILPSLLSVSLFLGMVQIAILVLLGHKSFGKERLLFLFAVIPPLTSIILRSSSVEFWNQYVITLVNIFFIYWAVKYLQDRSLWNLLAITALILLAPSLYLAGIVNALAMTVITLGLVILVRPRMDGFAVPVLSTIVIIILSGVLTWIPYFQNVPFEQIANYNKSTPGGSEMFQSAWESFFNLPSYVTFQWSERSTYAQAIKHADSRIISSISQILIRVIGRLYLIQAVFAFTAFVYLVTSRLWNDSSNGTAKGNFNINVARVVLLSVVFIAVSYTVSTWMGGPDWVNGERPDQNVQFLPMFLLIIFLLPFVVNSIGKSKAVITILSLSLLTLFCLANLLGGFSIIRNHLGYHGTELTEADIPLTDKKQALEFIVQDWQDHSDSGIIAVDYDIDGDTWDWVPEFGQQLLPWYPAPMTQGRSFDYELLRRYGITNKQEGIQLRTFGTGRYLITYAFEDPPLVGNGEIAHYIFGRLRVSIVK